MEKKDILKDLESRGLLYQTTDIAALKKRLGAGPISLYIGFDPTAESLHIGNLLPILVLKRFQMADHKPIAVAGGGTGLIGDPSGKSAERALNPEDIVSKWTEKIKCQLEKFLDFSPKISNPAQIVDNYKWLSRIKLIDFLRDTGKHFSLSEMLSKESVKSRLKTGISYTEFSYMILQSYDFLELFRNYKCEMQAGGSDQWGNIVAGIDLIRKITGGQAYGLTVPLVEKSDGSKFGKTEFGTIWLDAEKTTPYQFYQFWINADDRDVIKFINYFTFLSDEEISDLQEKIKKEPEKREAQYTLAREVTSLVHGKEGMTKAEKISRYFFGGKIKDLSEEELEEAIKIFPKEKIGLIRAGRPSSEKNSEIGLIGFLLIRKICSSARQAREDIKNGAISINDEICTDTKKIIKSPDKLFGKYIVIRKGKKNFYPIEWEV